MANNTWKSLGKVTVPVSGTPVRVTANQSNPLARFPAHAMLFQQVAGNTGRIYVLENEDADIATLAGVLAVLAIPTNNILPSASATVTYAPAAFNAVDFWVDAEVGGEACLVSAIQA